MNDTKLQDILAKADGMWGVVVKPIGQEAVFEHNADMEFPSASIGKVPIGLYVFHLVDTGAARLDQPFMVSEDYYLGGSGVLQYLTPGIQLTLKDLIALTLIVSDNTAAKLLARTFGPEKVNEYLESLGFSKTRLGVHADGAFDFGVTTAQEMVTLLEGIYGARFVSRSSSDLLLDIMKRCENDKGIRRYLPYDDHGGKKLEIANKSGALDDSRHDIGVVYASTPYVIAALSKDLSDLSYKPDNAGILTIARLSAAVYDELG